MKHERLITFWLNQAGELWLLSAGIDVWVLVVLEYSKPAV